MALGGQGVVRTAPLHARHGKMSWRALQAIPFDEGITSLETKLFIRLEDEVVRRICLGRLLTLRRAKSRGLLAFNDRGARGKHYTRGCAPIVCSKTLTCFAYLNHRRPAPRE